MSRNQRLGFLGIAAVIAIAAIIVLTAGGGGDEQEATGTAGRPTATPTASTTGEQDTPTPTPAPEPPLLQAGKLTKLRFEQGDTIRFRVRSDAPEHVHIHGYDILKDLEPGKTVSVSFEASITGIFEVELEDSAEEIGELRVDPR